MSYPRIEFKASKRNAVETDSPWRDKILVIDEFSKGPAEVINIKGNDFEEFFGVDASSGSATIQQILSTGATNIAVSRAIPEDSASRTSISVASGNITEVEPVVGYEVDAGEYNVTINETDYTIGLGVSAQYIGSPLVQRSIVSPVSTKDTNLVHPSFDDKDELGVVDLTVIDFKEGVAIPEVKHAAGDITVNVAAGTAGTQQVVKIAKLDGVGNDINIVDQSILPGYVFKGTGVELLILSKPFSLSTTTWGVLVENLDTTTAGAKTGVEVFDPEDSYYILGYSVKLQESFRPAAKTLDSTYHRLPDVFFTSEYVNERIDGCVALKVASATGTPANLGTYIQFKYQVVADAVTDPTNATAYALTAESFGAGADDGVQIMFGTLNQTSPIALRKEGKFSIPLASAYVLVGSDDEASELAYSVGTSAKQVITDLYEQLLGSVAFEQLFEEIDIAIDYIPYSLTMSSKIRGLESNRIKYKVDRFVAGTLSTALDIQVKFDVNDFAFTNPTETVALSGGFNGPRYAYRDLYALDGQPIIRVQALSPGVQDIKVTITPESIASREGVQFKLTAETTTSSGVRVETLTLFTKAIETDTGVFTGSLESSTVRVYFLPWLQYNVSRLGTNALKDLLLKGPARIEPPLAYYSDIYDGNYAVNKAGAAVLKSVALVGGRDFDLGSNESITAKEVRKRAYLAALKRSEAVDAAFVVLSGIAYGDPFYTEVFEEAILQTVQADVENGVRQLFLETPANMTGKQAELLSSSINNRLVTLVNGRVTQSLANGSFVTLVSALGYYAGSIATRPPQLAVQAALAGSKLQGIRSTNVKATKQFKTQVTDGRVDTIYYDTGLQAYKFLNGITTSSVSQDRYVSVNRIRNQVISDLYRNLQWVRSLSNTPELRGQIETAIGAYLQTKLQEGWFLQIGDVVCDESNNSSSDILNGRVNITLSYVPVLPADFIFVDLIEDYTLIENLTFTAA